MNKSALKALFINAKVEGGKVYWRKDCDRGQQRAGNHYQSGK